MLKQVEAAMSEAAAVSEVAVSEAEVSEAEVSEAEAISTENHQRLSQLLQELEELLHASGPAMSDEDLD